MWVVASVGHILYFVHTSLVMVYSDMGHDIWKILIFKYHGGINNSLSMWCYISINSRAFRNQYQGIISIGLVF
jgi:hypothetical protein